MFDGLSRNKRDSLCLPNLLHNPCIHELRKVEEYDVNYPRLLNDLHQFHLNHADRFEKLNY